MTALKHQIKEPVAELVTNGRFNFGIYHQPIPKLNPLDAQAPLFMRLPRFLNNLRLKEWVAYQAGNEDYFMLIDLYSAKTLCLTQFIVIDIKNQRKIIHEKMLPLGRIKVPSGLESNSFAHRQKGYSLEFRHNLAGNRLEIIAEIAATKKQPAISAHFTIHHAADKNAPMSVCIPLGKNRGMYSYKTLMPMEGSLRLDQKDIEFNVRDSWAIIDDHKGFYPYSMKYDWLTAARHESAGRLIGFNLTDNQSIDPEGYNENCLWINNTLHHLPPVKFYHPDGVWGTWLIKDRDGMVNLQMKPEFRGGIEINLVVLQTRYRTPYGRVSGYIVDRDGNKIEIDNFYGMGENKRIRM